MFNDENCVPTLTEEADTVTKDLEVADVATSNSISHNHVDLAHDPTAYIAEKKKDQAGFRPNALHFWGYAVATTIGGSFYGWNVAYDQGFGSFMIGLVLSGLSFLILTSSLSEIISSTGFSGGAFGMTRVVSGFYMGFIVAFLEVAEYITYISMSVLFMGDFVCDQFHLDKFWLPLLWIPFYLVSYVLLVGSQRVYWNFTLVLACFSVIVAMIYIFGYFHDFNMTRGASLGADKGNSSDLKNWFNGGMVYFLRYLPYTTWFFGGVETTSLLTDLLRDPKTQFPRAILSGTMTLAIIAIGISCVAVSMLDCIHEVRHQTFFMDFRFGKMGIHQHVARWLIFPGQFSMAFGFILPAGKLLHSMAKSQLLPTWLRLRRQPTPNRAILVACVASYLLCLLAHFVPSVNMVDIPILFGYLTYLVDLYSYWVFKKYFFTMKRGFISPFGLTGAVFAAIVFAFGAIGVIFYQRQHFTVIYVAGYIALLSVYYRVYVRKVQSFSTAETKSFLSLHMVKFNSRRKTNLRKGNTASVRSLQKAASTPRGGGGGGVRSGVSTPSGSRSLVMDSFDKAGVFSSGTVVDPKPHHSDSDSTMSVNSTSYHLNLSALFEAASARASSPMSNMFRVKVHPHDEFSLPPRHTDISALAMSCLSKEKYRQLDATSSTLGIHRCSPPRVLSFTHAPPLVAIDLTDAELKPHPDAVQPFVE